MRIAINGIKLYYQKLGTGAPLLLLHGHHYDGAMFDKLMSPLSLYYTVYALDMRGHGLSTGEPADHYKTEVDDVIAFAEQLHLKSFYVYGFDAGGLIAMLLAVERPELVKKIIVAGTFVNGAGIRPYHYLTEGLSRFVNRDRDSKVELTESYLSTKQLSQLPMPVLCVVGERDWVKVAHVRWYSQHIPKGRLILMPRQTHTSYTVHSLKMLDLIKDFCQSSEDHREIETTTGKSSDQEENKNESDDLRC